MTDKKKNIKVVIVDNSSIVRLSLKKLFNNVSGFEVIAAVSDPVTALKWMIEDWPDVIISDVNLSKMDGITFMKEVFSEKPVPFIIFSSVKKEIIESMLQKSDRQ